MEGDLHAIKKVRNSDEVETGIDLLSNLPHSIIYHILSLMETKYAVRTSVLSKSWRNHWTNIYTLHFVNENFINDNDHPFYDFVMNVLRRHKPVCMDKLKFHCRGFISGDLMMKLYSYARRHGFNELDTNVVCGFLPNYLKCQTLKTLKMSSNNVVSGDLYGFASLTTLQLDRVKISTRYEDIFSKCLNLENLSLLRCQWSAQNIHTISAPRLVNLNISTSSSLKFKTISPRLKFFSFDGIYPNQLMMDKYSTLDKVNIRLSPPTKIRLVYATKEEYIMEIVQTVQAFCSSKSLTVLLEFPKDQKFILYHNIADDEIKIVELDKKTGKEQLLFAFPMGLRFKVKKLTNILLEIEGRADLFE